MNWPVTTLFAAAAFSLGWWLGRRKLQAQLNTLSDDLKKSSDELAESVKHNQP